MVSFNTFNRIEMRYDRLATHPYGSAGKLYNFRGQQALKDAIGAWVNTLEEYGINPRYILSAGTYVNKPGMHGKGLAVDVDGLWFSPDDILMTLNAPRHWKRYLAVEATLRMHFSVVLNYDYNRQHRDHWHCDLTYSNLFYKGKNQLLFAQRVLNVFAGNSLEIDGKWGEKTETAFRGFMDRGSDNDSWIEFLEKIAGTWASDANISTPAEPTIIELANECYDMADMIRDEADLIRMKTALNNFFTHEDVQEFLH